ncbi:MAG: hypothetical protein J6I96_05850 [Oscillospiraceae bacterium]|nr:hypothetical protein [Oscillospiraceae bacterium]
MEKTQVFRKKSLERISSPEQLTDYLRVTDPGIWVLLAAIVCLLAALIAWGTVGKLETVNDGKAVVTDGSAVILVTGEPYPAAGMTVRIGSGEFEIYDTKADVYGNVLAYADVDLPDGSYSAKVVTESITPLSFLFS